MIAALARQDIASFVLNVPPGSVSTLSGVSLDEIRTLLDATEPPPGSRPAIALTPCGSTADAIVCQTLDALAETALALWPVWYTDIDFSPFGRNAAGEEAARLRVRNMATTTPGVTPPWAETAVTLALAGRPPRVPGIHAGVELRQLSLAISRSGVVVVMAPGRSDHAAAFVHSIEWMASSAAVPIILVLEETARLESAFDRLLPGAHTVMPEFRSPLTVTPEDGIAP